MTFEEARATYAWLRQQYDARLIGREEFARRVQALSVRDATGAFWAIDGATGAWLRYDGSRWVPGQPVVGPGYPAQQPVGYGYGQHAGSPVAPVVPSPPAQRAAPARAWRARFLVGILAAGGLLLLLPIVAGALLLGSGVVTFDTASGITDPVVATSIGADNRPLASASDFAPGSNVYITFTAKRMRAGQRVTARVTRNDQPVAFEGDTNVVMFHQDATYLGSIEYRPLQPGSYTIGLYVDGATTASQTLTFVVK